MSQVTLGHIEAAIKKVDTLDDSAIDRLTETHTTAQPVLLGYVMSASEEYQNEDLESLLVYYFTVILEDFSDQPDLVRFMALEVSMEDEDGATLDDETATQLFIVSLAMISLLSRSTNQ